MRFIRGFFVTVLLLVFMTGLSYAQGGCDTICKGKQAQIKAMINDLQQASEKSDYSLIKGHLADKLAMKGVPADYSKMILKKLINDSKRQIEKIDITEYVREDADIRVKLSVQVNGETESRDVLVTEDLKFKEINVYKIQATTQPG